MIARLCLGDRVLDHSTLVLAETPTHSLPKCVCLDPASVPEVSASPSRPLPSCCARVTMESEGTPRKGA